MRIASANDIAGCRTVPLYTQYAYRFLSGLVVQEERCVPSVASYWADMPQFWM